MFERVFDSLGPQFVTGTKQPIAEALRENASVANQIHSRAPASAPGLPYRGSPEP